MKKTYAMCLSLLCVSLFCMGSAKVGAETAPFNSSANAVLTKKIDLSEVKRYLSSIKDDFKKEAEKYKEQVLNTPPWESELQEEEVSSAN